MRKDKENDGTYVGVVGADTLDRAVGAVFDLAAGIEAVTGTEREINIYDAKTGKHIVQIEPPPERNCSLGWTRSFAKGWERMEQRSRERKAKGQSPTDD